MGKKLLSNEESFSFAEFIVLLSKLKDRLKNNGKDELWAHINTLQKQVIDIWVDLGEE